MKIEGTYSFRAGREKVWQALLDPAVLARCLPGCEALDETGPDQYEATAKIGIAAVKGTYKGKVRIENKRPPSSYVLRGEGTASAGFFNGQLAIELEEGEADEGTFLKYAVDAQVGGLIASLGQRMLGSVGKMIMGQFFKQVAKSLEEGAGA